METLILTTVVSSVLSAALGFVLGRYVWPAIKADDQTTLVSAKAECDRLRAEVDGLKVEAAGLNGELKAAVAEARQHSEQSARLEEREKALTNQFRTQTESLTSSEDAHAGTAKGFQSATEEVARLQERERALNQQIETLQSQQAGLQEQLKAEFENIGTRILKANAAELSQNSEKALTTILNPLREHILEFQKKVETTYDAEVREILTLKEQIRLIVETNQALGTQADGLAKALRGDVQLLGRWGELVLERILEQAGLREGSEYISQGRGMGLKSDAGGSLKPDIVLLLPEKRTMIVDSKVSLASYDRLIAATGETERAEQSAQLVRDMKAHIDDLASKRYQDNEKIEAHDCVLMFVPIEGALAAALTAGPELFTYGWDKRVVLVGPPTLLMTLRTIASIWRYELQAQNAQEIGRLAGALCDKVSDSLVDFNNTTEKIGGALAAHNEAMKRLTSGKGNVLGIGERIRNLGVKTKKPIPAVLVDGQRIAASAQSDETEADDE